MPVSLREAMPKNDYKLEIVTQNGNTMLLDMLPRLEDAEFRILRKKSVWREIAVTDDCIWWGTDKTCGLPVSRLPVLFQSNEKGEKSEIHSAAANEDWRLQVQLSNGSQLTMNIEPLLEYSLFAPLVQSRLWRNVTPCAHSLLWEDESLRLELRMDTILNYFT